MNLVLAPIFEELLFRGVLFSALRQRLSFFLAALLSAVVFGTAHLASAAEGAALVGVALWFAFVFESTGSLLPCVVGHATMNWVYGLVQQDAGRQLAKLAPGVAPLSWTEPSR